MPLVAAERTYFDQAVDVLRLAMQATQVGEQSVLLEEALRLNRLALAQEMVRPGAKHNEIPSASHDGVPATSQG